MTSRTLIALLLLVASPAWAELVRVEVKARTTDSPDRRVRGTRGLHFGPGLAYARMAIDRGRGAQTAPETGQCGAGTGFASSGSMALPSGAYAPRDPRGGADAPGV